MPEAIVVGGGPAGLACAIELATRGVSVVVLEASSGPPDKACGEGLMPAGVRALERLGALALVDPASTRPFEGIRYLQEDGVSLEARFRDGSGLGVRRPALVAALTRRARDVGVEVRHGAPVVGHERSASGVRVTTPGGAVEGAVLVAADGLASPLRRAAGLERPPPRAGGRFGMRRHFAVEPWSSFVEVHWSEGVEAYVTPVGGASVGLAFLWDRGRVSGEVSFGHFLERFPVLAARLADAVPASAVRGAGPLARAARRRVADRLVLAGDAAGYVDAITGEGLTLAFVGARALGEILPQALARGATARALEGYERAGRRVFRSYAFFARAVLALGARPWLRKRILRGLARRPRLFERLLGLAASAVDGASA